MNNDLDILMKLYPAKFKSKALDNAVRNLGKLPVQLNRIGALITKAVKRNLSGRILNKRTGKLHDSWQWQISAENSGWSLTVGSDVVYARIHNFGGFTGAGYRTKIRKTRYFDKAILTTKSHIRRLLRDFIVRITR